MAALSALSAYDLSDEGDSDEEKDETKPEEEDGSPAAEEVEVKKTEEEKVEDELSVDEIGSNFDVDDAVYGEDESMIVSDEEDEPRAENGADNEAPKPAKMKFKRYSCESATALAQKLHDMVEEEVQLPPEPDGRCSKQLQDKIKRLYERKIKEGENLNQTIQERKDFRNPSIYDKLILFLGIEERGTNFHKSEFDPTAWRKVPDYEDLARAQREDVAKKEREKKTKVEFVTGTVKKPPQRSGSGEPVKKSKWDKPADDSKTMTKPGSGITTLPTSKTTIISAVGTMKKPKP